MSLPLGKRASVRDWTSIASPPLSWFAQKKRKGLLHGRPKNQETADHRWFSKKNVPDDRIKNALVIWQTLMLSIQNSQTNR